MNKENTELTIEMILEARQRLRNLDNTPSEEDFYIAGHYPLSNALGSSSFFIDKFGASALNGELGTWVGNIPESVLSEITGEPISITPIIEKIEVVDDKIESRFEILDI